MKLKIVKARIGLQWVRLGMRTFFRQPLAMAGLFFLYMAMISVATLIPVIGTLIALGLLPAATLGLMAASQEADRGKFPMPSILVSAFRAGKQEMRAMLTLGVLYAAGFLIVLAISSLFDGGQFAMLYLMGGEMTRELAQTPDFRTAMLVALALYLPLSLMFWHAPALVHWHGVPPVKSLFFSFIACWKNFGAYTLYGIGWAGVFAGSIIVISLFAALMNSETFAAYAMFPLALLMAAMFFTSIYFTFRDSFVYTQDTPGEQDDTTHIARP